MVEASDLSEPTSYDEEAMNSRDQAHWRKASRAGLESVRLPGVFRFAKLPKGQCAIGTKWVFKRKRNADGSINKCKARLSEKSLVWLDAKCKVVYSVLRSQTLLAPPKPMSMHLVAMTRTATSRDS